MSGPHHPYLSIIREGLRREDSRREDSRPRAAAHQRVIIVGAGMAGLVAAYELLRAGHDPQLLEARQRVGGRILTLREPFTDGLYGNAGAMRIPRSHELTLAYVAQWGLPLAPFVVDNPQAYRHIQGHRHRVADSHSRRDSYGFDLRPDERQRPIAALWEEALAPLRREVSAGGERAWGEIAERYDDYSLRRFLAERGWSPGAIELFGLATNQEALLNSAFLELLREELGDCYRDLHQVVGGLDLLPRAFLPALRDRVRFGAQVTALAQDDQGVTVTYRTGAGVGQVTGDRAIVTAPLPVLRQIEITPPFSHAKRRAIRQLHYETATKIFLQCRRRFWEQDEGIQGGLTVTDLPIRTVYYPTVGGETGRGLLLASYTWGMDALRWGALPRAERVRLAVEDVAKIHPQIAAEFEVGASVAWHLDEFAGGAFALFAPGQQRQLHEAIAAPEGRIHLAGEHTSLTHAWIQGAIESGLRAALEVHQARNPDADS